MPYFEVGNMHWGYQVSTAKIFRMYVNNNNKYTIILPEEKDSVYPKETYAQTMQHAKENAAKYFIIGEMNALEEVMIISINMYNATDSSKVWGDVLKVRSPDDLDPILQKFANNLGTEQKASKDGDIYNVSNYDSKLLNKIDAKYSFGGSISGAYCIIPNVKNTFPAGFGLLVSYDLRDVVFDIQGDLLLGDIKIYDVRISGLYPFMKTKHTPFIGGSFAWGGTTIDFKDYTNKSNYGLSLYLNGGYIFNRNSVASLRITGSLFAPIYEVYNRQMVGFMFGTAIIF